MVNHSGRLSVWHYLDQPPCALVIPVTEEGKVALIKVWRVSVARWCLEAPAGRVEPGESPVDTAVREMAEEIGGDCSAVHSLGSVLASTGSTNERLHLFVTHGVRMGPSRPDPHEQIRVVLMNPDRAVEAALEGQVDDGPSALAVLWAHARGLLRGAAT
ncbi:NUDIX hydrolase [Streptomyces sp. NPDC001073]